MIKIAMFYTALITSLAFADECKNGGDCNWKDSQGGTAEYCTKCYAWRYKQLA